MHERDDDRFEAQVREAYRAAAPGDGAAEARTRSRALASAPRGLAWWVGRGFFELRPAAVAAGFMLTFVAGAWLGGVWSARSGTHAKPAGAVTPAAATAGVTTTFVIRAPGATRVNVAGDFNNWDAEATPMRQSASGDLWVVEVPLPSGMHQYSFVLDGREWRPDPAAPLASDAAMGSRNSVVIVKGRSEL